MGITEGIMAEMETEYGVATAVENVDNVDNSEGEAIEAPEESVVENVDNVDNPTETPEADVEDVDSVDNPDRETDVDNVDNVDNSEETYEDITIITFASFNKSPKELARMVMKGEISLQNVFQRAFCWTKAQKCALIHSIIMGYYIPPIVANRTPQGVYDFLDGKQRTTTITTFLKGDFALSGVGKVRLDDGSIYDFEGKHYVDLPEELKDRFAAYSLEIKYADGLTQDQIRTLFKKLNNGKALSTKDRNTASCGDIEEVINIADHPFFKKTQTEKFIEARKQVSWVFKMHSTLFQDISKVSFESKVLNDYIESLTITDEQANIIHAVLDKALAISKLFDKGDKIPKNRFLARENNFMSLTPFLRRAIDEDVSDEKFLDFLRTIFTQELTVSDRYSKAAKDSVAKNGSIVARNEELEKAWDSFFGTEEEVANAVTEYRYGMRLRGFAPGTFPKEGFVEREDAPVDTVYYDVLVYNRELTEKEISDYELDVM